MTVADVLIVDDDAATRSGLAELLTGAGFSVTEARDGPAALATLEGSEFGVVLLDVHMPGVDGLEVLSRCVERHTHSKIIVMTGTDATETVLAALRGQAYEFFPKPIEPWRLLDSVKRALGSGDAVPAIDVISARPDWLELLVPCTREAVDRVQSFVQRLEMDLPDEVRESVGLAFRELLMNGIEWGGHLNASQKVRVACVRTPRLLVYRIQDPGPGFRADDLPHACDARAPGDHDEVRQRKGLRPGGFGLALIKAMADDLVYNERRNEVLFVKYLDAGAAGATGATSATGATGAP